MFRGLEVVELACGAASLMMGETLEGLAGGACVGGIVCGCVYVCVYVGGGDVCACVYDCVCVYVRGTDPIQ